MLEVIQFLLELEDKVRECRVQILAPEITFLRPSSSDVFELPLGNLFKGPCLDLLGCLPSNFGRQDVGLGSRTVQQVGWRCCTEAKVVQHNDRQPLVGRYVAIFLTPWTTLIIDSRAHQPDPLRRGDVWVYQHGSSGEHFPRLRNGPLDQSVEQSVARSHEFRALRNANRAGDADELLVEYEGRFESGG